MNWKEKIITFIGKLKKEKFRWFEKRKNAERTPPQLQNVLSVGHQYAAA